jgi:hypothetical protein
MIHSLQKLQKEKCALTHHYKCKKKGASIIDICEDTLCEWRLKSEKYLNCTWVACNFGPFTLEEVGAMLGVTRERIRQIEAAAIIRLQKRSDHLLDLADGIHDHSRYDLDG